MSIHPALTPAQTSHSMKPTIPALIALLSCLTSGCVTRITYKNEPRRGVRFSNVQAAQAFYEALLFANTPKGRGVVSLGIPLPYGHRTLSTANVRFNEAVQTADSNHDGIISESEARAFASRGRGDKPSF